jgi:enamine deaminase RidA (YjgF/YER057c/UK114 family)
VTGVQTCALPICSYPNVAIGNSTGKRGEKNNALSIMAVKGDLKEFKYLRCGKKIVGTYFSTSDCEFLYLTGISGLIKNPKSNNFTGETLTIYKKIQQILAAHNFSVKNVHRFWNYMENISKNYSAFNEARGKFFKENGVIDFPVATGIQARLLNKQHINISLEALKLKKNSGITIESIQSDLQCEPTLYGPKFSRAKLLKFKKDGVAKMYISGTSSVNKQGKSVLQENPEKNIRYVVSSVEHLLKKSKMSLNDIATARVYCKNEEILKYFEKLQKENSWEFPYSTLVTNICRSNLLFEMECIAANKHLNSNQISYK